MTLSRLLASVKGSCLIVYSADIDSRLRDFGNSDGFTTLDLDLLEQNQADLSNDESLRVGLSGCPILRLPRTVSLSPA